MRSVTRALIITSLAALTGCKGIGDTSSVVVYFSVDTLGQAMANETGWCARLTDLLGEYDLSLACVEGGVAPSSWTGESHTRMLWPQHMAGRLRANHYPECGEASVLEEISTATRGGYLFGADNGVLSSSGKGRCGAFRSLFTQGTDKRWETSTGAWQLPDIPEAERPAYEVISSYEDHIEKNTSVQLFVNAMEPGGHAPRCWFNPGTPACDELWEVLVYAGVVAAGADRRAAWLGQQGPNALNSRLQGVLSDQEARWRELMWEVIRQSVDNFEEPTVDYRLRRILDATEEAGRLHDLRLVILGDHGENPCIDRGFDTDTLACGHNGVTTAYTGFVPVFLSPAGLADQWRDLGLVGAADAPWSTANLAYGLMASVDLPIPSGWPASDPAGVAASWNCLHADRSGPGGVHIHGDKAMRCQNGVCEASTFSIPQDHTYTREVLEVVPDSLAVYGEDWSFVACDE